MISSKFDGDPSITFEIIGFRKLDHNNDSFFPWLFLAQLGDRNNISYFPVHMVVYFTSFYSQISLGLSFYVFIEKTAYSRNFVRNLVLLHFITEKKRISAIFPT